jgi:hypothetical protein
MGCPKPLTAEKKKGYVRTSIIPDGIPTPLIKVLSP